MFVSFGHGQLQSKREIILYDQDLGSGSVYYTKPKGVQDSVSAGSGKVLDN